ncbi:MAG: hypothetical protein COX77_02205 [Candidatus Komeilibacteria bacterium CG_4_10_14_0_2_um_filter_37_10]|uniref:Secretion system C-terminal sorting domain-containing protein n=1 Tax=Candidatus Komeilibacteria bacterium CG_4_10_14_0_2_um_filter_37_10 TaxID=1974470 RepID=A0A2M7VF54_9BACT|nr:MAG: hypothetical protein COX77_02205 [Candidatus Komeilibacteria bacterium CG_4_10_14_0_2_um_filter_37_10]
MHGYYVVETANSFYQTNKEASVLIYDSTYFWGSVSDGEYSGIVSPSGYKIGNQKNGTYYNVLPDTGMGTIAIKYCQGKYSIVGNQYDGTERIIFDLPLNSSQIYSLQRVINKYVIQLSGSRWLISDDNMQTHHDYSFNDGEYLFLVEDGRILLVKNEIVYELKENSISSYSVVTKDDLSFNLHQNYPNPFNPITNISFSLPNSSQVQLKIYDILGKEVTTLINEEKTAGNYQITFDGGKLTSGTYFYKLSAGSYTAIKKMVLMK